MNTISIITPSFNQGIFLEEMILSVIHQSYKNFELIIVDGGSTDNSIEIIKKYERHITYWVSEKDSGQSDAINKGLQKATGTIVTWLNSDDYYEAGTLEFVNKTFSEHTHLGVLHGKSLFFGEGMKPVLTGPDKTLKLEEYLAFMRFPQPSSFYKNTLLGPQHFVNTHLHYGMDFELLASSLLLGNNIMAVNVLLSNYRLHPTSKSNNELNFLKDWALTVGRIFCSFSDGKPFLKWMHQLGLIDKMSLSAYPTSINLSEAQLECIFLEHLYIQYHTHYRNFRKADCKRISQFVRSHYLGFFSEKQFRKYDLRLHLIPKFVYTLFR